MKYWFSQAVTFAFAALVLSGCGGGSDGPGAVRPGGLAAQPVELPAQVTRVEPYQRPASAFTLKRDMLVDPDSRPAPAIVRLARLDAAKAAAGPLLPGRPMQIGTGREVAQSADPQRMRGLLQFKPGAAGKGPTAAVSFTSPGAAGVRLGLQVTELPGAARVRGYAQGGATAFDLAGSEILAVLGRNRDAGDVSDKGRTFWTPVIESEEVTLEISLPVGLTFDSVRVSVPTLSHVAVRATELEALMVGQAASCEVDVSCSTDAVSPSGATARMIFVEGSYSYVCTGTLLNDAQSSGIPYFLSADHCVSTQTAASSLITFWSYRSASCNSLTVDPTVTQLNGGATLLYSSTATDTSLMRLNALPPASAVYAGWSASPPQFGQELIGIHHPRGDLQKISRGTLAGFISCTVGLTASFSCNEAPMSVSNYLYTQWSSGTVESGSSGSGLFATVNGNRYLVGQLKGGSASCRDPGGLNAYGRFDVAYNTALSRWLSPIQSAAGQVQAQALPAAATPRIPIHRFFNTTTGSHFFTPYAGERDYVIATYPWFKYEGVGFYAYAQQVVGSHPVYRMYNRATGRHFFTMVSTERDIVLKDPVWTDEGTAWWAQWGGGGTATAVYRFNNPGTASHFYTISEAERDIVLKNNPDFRPEGVGYYAWTTQ